MKNEEQVKNKIFDEMFTKINAVLGGKFDPSDFSEELALRIANLEISISNLSDIMAEQENEIKKLKKEKEHWIQISGEKAKTVMDSLKEAVEKYQLVDVSVGAEMFFGVSREIFNGILNQLEKTGYKELNLPVWYKRKIKVLAKEDMPISEIMEKKNSRYIPVRGFASKDIKEFNPNMYRYDELVTVNIDKRNEIDFVSRLITNMVDKGATEEEIDNIIKYSMVVIDAEKKMLNWRQAAIDFQVQEIANKYMLSDQHEKPTSI